MILFAKTKQTNKKGRICKRREQSYVYCGGKKPRGLFIGSGQNKGREFIEDTSAGFLLALASTQNIPFVVKF